MAFDSHSNFVDIQKLRKELNAKSGNLVRYDISHVADVDGQTEFAIDLSTFDYLTDSVWVVSGRTMLSATLDYTVYEHNVILNEGVPLGRTIDIYVYKNVENLDTEKTINGLQLGIGSVPLDRLADTPIPVEYGGTGAPTAKEARVNLGAFGYGAEIPASSDLNDYKKSGLYNYRGENSQTILNKPFDSGATMILVLDALEYDPSVEIVMQIAYSVSPSKTNMVFRKHSSGTWSEWSTYFLPLTGGTLSGGLKIETATPTIYLDGLTSNRRTTLGAGSNGTAILGNYSLEDANDWTAYYLRPETVDLKTLAQVIRTVNGSATPYNLFGEHNSNRTQLVASETTPTKNNEIYWTYK